MSKTDSKDNSAYWINRLIISMFASLFANSPTKEKREASMIANFPFSLLNLAPQHGLEPRT